jgi:hypothetical protein
VNEIRRACMVLMKASAEFRVILLIGITVAVEVVLTIWFDQRTYGSRPLDPSTEVIASWSVIVSATALFIAILDPKRLSTWFIAVLFVIGTVLGSFLAGHAALSHYRFNRQFTSESREPIRPS